MATLRVSRYGKIGLARGLKVLLDGAVICSVDQGRVALIEVTPGTHSVAVKMDWVQSKPLEFTIVEGETVAVEGGGSLWSFGQRLEVRLNRE
jgi:hypothetical protein